MIHGCELEACLELCSDASGPWFLPGFHVFGCGGVCLFENTMRGLVGGEVFDVLGAELPFLGDVDEAPRG